MFCRSIERVHTVAPPATRWLHLGAGTCIPLMKTICLCGVPASASSAANDAASDDMRELLESVGLLQLYPLFEEEEMTDSSTLVQMLPRPEQLREALKEVGVGKIGQREKIVAALKEKSAGAAVSPENDVRVSVRSTKNKSTVAVIAFCRLPGFKQKVACRYRPARGITQAISSLLFTACSRTTRYGKESS